MRGRILKGVGGLYTLRSDGRDYLCRARGRFRKDKLSPIVGDFAEFVLPADEGEGFITELLPRRNCLKRPLLSNVDMLVTVVAAADPLPDWSLVDRLLTQAEKYGMEAVLAVNKSDLGQETAEEAKKVYRHLPVLSLSAVANQGLDALQDCIGDRTVVLAGPSGVGKSSLLNRLLPESALVGEISDRLKRGKHTTRHTQLFSVGKGYVADTPGFSLLDMDLMDPAELAALYPDFGPYSEQCRFTGCIHYTEPDCGIKAAVEGGKIDSRRYKGYIRLLAELTEQWRNRYA
ncbi:MAG: ribosome small subunit-dependent GTPase A [Christensenellales bacterium]|jgi:ribosome biogenesis GTPase